MLKFTLHGSIMNRNVNVFKYMLYIQGYEQFHFMWSIYCFCRVILGEKAFEGKTPHCDLSHLEDEIPHCDLSLNSIQKSFIDMTKHSIHIAKACILKRKVQYHIKTVHRTGFCVFVRA